MNIRIKRIDKNLPLPGADKNAACFDFPCRTDVTLAPGEVKPVPLNTIMEVPAGYVLQLLIRSSMPIKRGLTLANGVGIVDPFYSGDQDEIVALLHNITSEPVEVKRGELLVQGMIVKTEEVHWREVDQMGTDGHGGYVI